MSAKPILIQILKKIKELQITIALMIESIKEEKIIENENIQKHKFFVIQEISYFFKHFTKFKYKLSKEQEQMKNNLFIQFQNLSNLIKEIELNKNQKIQNPNDLVDSLSKKLNSIFQVVNISETKLLYSAKSQKFQLEKPFLSERKTTKSERILNSNQKPKSKLKSKLPDDKDFIFDNVYENLLDIKSNENRNKNKNKNEDEDEDENNKDPEDFEIVETYEIQKEIQKEIQNQN
ncbi:hypothetical protein M0811_14080 [Anaeramoeba ignava]|uniref:Uncharacterized protein n=1 Tax=Anaeramoeba ignava TaxID=1746090 RepID=A0A9Q0LXC5_ANAIG|nr:hypothetical protein M0811_14080 [Anaeramoeba ignava]